jgi:hypothetical protein
MIAAPILIIFDRLHNNFLAMKDKDYTTLELSS